MNFVLQVFVTPTYWALIHGPMVDSKKFPSKINIMQGMNSYGTHIST